MAFKDKKSFVFNGIESDNLSIANVNVDTGMADEPFLATSMINEIEVKGRTKPYYMGKTYQPLILNLSFAFLEPWNDELIREVARTFDVDYYKPLYFEDEDDVIYYCMPVDDSRLIHNSLQEGYVNITMRCNDKYAYSRVKSSHITDNFDAIRFSNQGDTELYPELIFIKDEHEGDVTIINNTNEIELKFVDILANEEIYVDCENEIIENKSLSSLYRYNNHNNKFLKMERGSNRLEATGIIDLKFRWRFKTLQS